MLFINLIIIKNYYNLFIYKKKINFLIQNIYIIEFYIINYFKN